jgi:hypothetical protein
VTTHDLVAPTTDGDDQGVGGEVAGVGSVRLDAGVVSAPAANSPPPAPPLTVDEADSIICTVWSDLAEDPRRFDDLLTQAVGFIAGVALQPGLGGVALRAAECLRAMEQRALWGPDHEHEDHR